MPENPAIVAEAKRTFKDEIGGIEYRPLLPSDQKPPTDLNRDNGQVPVAKSDWVSGVVIASLPRCVGLKTQNFSMPCRTHASL
jgi:hypothetical protein